MRGAAGPRLAPAHAEFDALALTAGVEVVACVTNPRSGEPHSRFFLHQGKVDALVQNEAQDFESDEIRDGAPPAVEETAEE